MSCREKLKILIINKNKGDGQLTFSEALELEMWYYGEDFNDLVDESFKLYEELKDKTLRGARGNEYYYSKNIAYKINHHNYPERMGSGGKYYFVDSVALRPSIDKNLYEKRKKFIARYRTPEQDVFNLEYSQRKMERLEKEIEEEHQRLKEVKGQREYQFKMEEEILREMEALL